VFDLAAPLLAQGRSDTLCAASDALTITLKVYASGGENALHAHPGEDHAFVVLAGEATFEFGDGSTTVLGPNQGVLVPRGSYYRFQSTSADNLVMVRAGAPIEGPAALRVGADGADLPADSAANMHVAPVALEGRSFGPPPRGAG
jgi:mannose-6-phosphate isomerase-like protein (cupin superfamily)